MYLAKLETKGFRCLDNFTVELHPGLNVIVGSNNAGKTAIVEAISLVLSAFSNSSREIFPTAGDFWHDYTGDEREENQFQIILELKNIPEPNIHFSEWMISGRSERTACIQLICYRDLTDSDRIKPKWFVGDMRSSPDYEAMERIRPVFLPPLRNAIQALRPARGSRLARLVQQIAKSSRIRTGEIEDRFKSIQNEIIQDPPFSTAINRINERLLEATGVFRRQVAHLKFVEPDFRRIAESLEISVGMEGKLDYALQENGLGYNNILYIATILSQLSEDSEQDLRLLLIEEPEAHLHPQMQQVLVDALIQASDKYQLEGKKQSQVILTSHSPTLVAHVPIDKITVLHLNKVDPPTTTSSSARPQQGKPLARAIHTFGLTPTMIRDLSRYLDSTKANLFFAEGVVLVEGIAETLLLPVIAKAINRPLNEYHVSIVNIDGLAFDPFVNLFNSLSRLQIPCAVITDSDPRFRKGDKFYSTKTYSPEIPYDSNTEDETEGDEILFPETLSLYGRAYDLEQQVNSTQSGVRVFRSLKTLEYDMALTNYLEYMLTVYRMINEVKSSEIEEAIASESNNRHKAIRFFKRFSPKDKGKLAQGLAHTLDEKIKEHWELQQRTKGNARTSWDVYLEPPSYISNAIKWVTGDCNWEAIVYG